MVPPLSAVDEQASEQKKGHVLRFQHSKGRTQLLPFSKSCTSMLTGPLRVERSPVWLKAITD